MHNPANCFHFRLEWIAITAKLVEETISQWARVIEKYGLTLIEAPVDEVCAITKSNPFRAPLLIELSLEPPSLDTDGGIVVTSDDREVWMAKILRHWNFVLDQEAADKFPKSVDVAYSWGLPSFKYTQYIHRSGMSLCQITPTGFLWLTNRLYVSRAAGMAPMTSLPSPVRISSSIIASEPDLLRNQFREWCQDPEKLRSFYEQARSGPTTGLSAYEKSLNGSHADLRSADDKSSILSIPLT